MFGNRPQKPVRTGVPLSVPRDDLPVAKATFVQKGVPERVPIIDPDLDNIYGGQTINHISAPKAVAGFVPPPGYNPDGTRIATASQQPTEVTGLFADPMSAEDVENLSKRKKRTTHRFLLKAKVCVNCKYFDHYKRGKDNNHMNLCTFHGGVPWTESWTCSYSYCEQFIDKEEEVKNGG